MSKIYHRKQHVFSILLIWLLVISFPLVLNAEDALVTCTGLDCEFCDLISTGQRVLNWLVGVLTILAVLLFVYAGLILVTSLGNRTFKQKAFTIFNNVIIGYLLVLAGWLLVDTTLKALANQAHFAEGGVIGPWNRIECVDQPIPDTMPMGIVREGAGAADPIQDQVTEPLTPSEGEYSHEEAATILAENGIEISSSENCSDRSNRRCTSLDGVQELSIQRIVELNEAVGVGVVITGGTEVGHSTSGEFRHDNGYKIDIRTTDAVNTYIENNYEPLGGNRYSDPNGNIYWRHGPVDHWDITITN